MSPRVLAFLGSKKIPLTIATEIKVKGQVVAKRLVDVIDSRVLQAVTYKVEAAFNGDTLISQQDKQQLDELEVTSMPHESEADPNCHISVALKKNQNIIKKGHVTIDPAQQQPAR